VELARQASRAAWLSGRLTAAPGVGAIKALVGIDAARLIVVDYAETRAEQPEVLLPGSPRPPASSNPCSAPHPRYARHGTDRTVAPRHRSDALDRLDDVEQHLRERWRYPTPHHRSLPGRCSTSTSSYVPWCSWVAPREHLWLAGTMWLS
jgi:hypothetical protein